MTAGIRYFAFSTLFLISFCVFAVSTQPQGSVGADFMALGLTYGMVLACLGGVFGALRKIQSVDGEMDWGMAVPADKAAIPSGGRIPTTS